MNSIILIPEVEIVDFVSQVVNKVCDFCDTFPVPLHLLGLVNILHELAEPAVNACDQIVFAIVNLQHVDVVRGRNCIDDGVFVHKQLQGKLHDILLYVVICCRNKYQIGGHCNILLTHDI